MVAKQPTPSKRTAMRRRFGAALRLAGETQATWAAKEGISWGHLSYVLNGRRVSRRLMARVAQWSDETIAAHGPTQLSA